MFKVFNCRMWRKTALIFLIIMGVCLMGIPFGYSPEASSEAELLLRVYPDMNIELEMQTQGTSSESESMGITSMSIQSVSRSVGDDITEGETVMTFTPTMEYLFMLAVMDLNISSHYDEGDYSTEMKVGIPGYGGIEGILSGTLDQATQYSTLTFDVNVTIYYTLLMPEMVEAMLEAFPEFSMEIVDTIENMTQGNMTITEMSLVNYEMGVESTRAWLRVSAEGDFEKAGIAMASSEYLDYANVTSTTPELSLQGLEVITSDLSIYIDQEDFSLKFYNSGQIKGDMDEWFNEYIEVMYESVVETLNETESIQKMEDLILNSEVGIRDANISIEYNQGEVPEFSMELYGVTIKPSNMQTLLQALQNASDGNPESGYTLIFEGAEDGNKYVEINVPEETTDPTETSSRRVVWNFRDLEELDKVTFNVKDKESSDPGATFGQLDYIVPAVGVAGLAIAAYLLLKRK